MDNTVSNFRKDNKDTNWYLLLKNPTFEFLEPSFGMDLRNWTETLGQQSKWMPPVDHKTIFPYSDIPIFSPVADTIKRC